MARLNNLAIFFIFNHEPTFSNPSCNFANLFWEGLFPVIFLYLDYQ